MFKREPLSKKGLRSYSVTSVRSTGSASSRVRSDESFADELKQLATFLKFKKLKKREAKVLKGEAKLRGQVAILEPLDHEVKEAKIEKRRENFLKTEFQSRREILESLQDWKIVGEKVIKFYSVIPLRGVSEEDINRWQETIREFERKHPSESADWLGLRQALEDLRQLDSSGPPISTICSAEFFSELSKTLRDVDEVSQNIEDLLRRKERLKAALARATRVNRETETQDTMKL